MYVADQDRSTHQPHVQVFSKSGVYLRTMFGTDESIQYISSLAVEAGKGGRVYVADNGYRVQAFSKTGEFVCPIGADPEDDEGCLIESDSFSSLGETTRVAIDRGKGGRVYVSDNDHTRVLIFLRTAIKCLGRTDTKN